MERSSTAFLRPTSLSSIMDRGLDLRMTASHCLSVFVGCPHSPTQLPAGPCLVVNAEAIDQNEWLSEESFFTHRHLRSDERLITIDETVITAYDQELVEWHIFSDDRFNGPWELSDFTDQFPNLRLRSFKTIKGVTLYTILNKQKILADPFSTYQLFIRQGDPLIISGHKKEIAQTPHSHPRQHCKTDRDPVLPPGSTGFIPCKPESAEDQIEAEKSN